MTVRARIWPVESRIRSVLGLRKSMDDLCVSRTVVCPEETSAMPPVIMSSQQQEMVTGCQPATTLAHEWDRIAGFEGQHKATVRYEFKNVLATPHGFFVGGHGFSQVNHPPFGKLATGKIHRAKRGFFCLSPTIIKFFGHWLHDGLPLTLLRQDDEDLFFPAHHSWTHAKGYLDLLDIAPMPHDFVLFDQMSYCIDVGQNSNRRGRTQHIQDRLRLKGTQTQKRVYISRGSTGAKRLISNEAALISALKMNGFRIVHASDSFDEMRTACQGCDISLSIEGSQMAHALLFANPSAFHVSINPSDLFNNAFADYMPSFGARLGTYVAQKDGDGYHVDIDGLLAFIAEHAPS